MLSPEDLEYANYYILPSYPNDESVHITDYFLSLTNNPTIDDVLSNYPYGESLHSIAMAAAANNDVVTMSILVSLTEYVPIRWSIVWESCRDDKTRFLIERSERYRPVKDVGMKNEVEITNDNYLVVLHEALSSSRLDVVEEILNNYGSPRQMMEVYEDAPLPPMTRKYLVSRNYIRVGEKERKIILDDPVGIGSLSSSDIEDVLRYDSINVFKEMVKTTNQVSLIHGQILTYLVTTSTNQTLLERLLPICTYSDLSILINRQVILLPIYLEIGRRGYFEMLGGMSRSNLLLFTTSRYYSSMSTDVKNYITNMYSDVEFSYEELMEGAIINANMSLVSQLISSYKYNTKHLSSLVYQYHMWDSVLVNSLLGMVSIA